MVKVEEQDALGLRQLSPKLISTCVITKYVKLHYSTLIRVVESYIMALIQHMKSKMGCMEKRNRKEKLQGDIGACWR